MKSTRRFSFLILTFIISSAEATIFWAAPNGNSSANCASVSGNSDPGIYTTIGRAANCAVTAGDIIYVKPGTYTGNNHRIKTDVETTGLANGTSQAYTTVMGVPGQAKPLINISNWFTTYRPPYHRNYIAIKNLIIDGDCVSQGRGCDSGAELYINGAYYLVEDVEIRNSWNVSVASFSNTTDTTACTWNHHHTIRNSKFQATGRDGGGYAIYSNACDTVFEHNEVTNARSGAIQIYQDSPFSVDRAVIRYNYIHDMEVATQPGFEGLCFGIAVDGANVQIDHNIMDMSGCANAKSGDAIGTGYGNTNGVATITHNLIYKPRSNGVSVGIFTPGGITGTVIKNNIILGSAGPAIMHYEGSTSIAANNKTTGALTDCTVSLTNFVQKANSSCIDAGTVTSDQSYNGSAPDIGPFEAFNVLNSSVSGNILSVTFALPLNSPVSPSTGATGFSVNNGRSVVSAKRSSSQNNTIEVSFSGNPCLSGETWTASYSPGNINDSVVVGNPGGVFFNQPLNAFTTNATNNCTINNPGPSPAPTPIPLPPLKKPAKPTNLRIR